MQISEKNAVVIKKIVSKRRMFLLINMNYMKKYYYKIMILYGLGSINKVIPLANAQCMDINKKFCYMFFYIYDYDTNKNIVPLFTCFGKVLENRNNSLSTFSPCLSAKEIQAMTTSVILDVKQVLPWRSGIKRTQYRFNPNLNGIIIG